MRLLVLLFVTTLSVLCQSLEGIVKRFSIQKFASKIDDVLLKYDDLTILKITFVIYRLSSNFANFNIQQQLLFDFAHL